MNALLALLPLPSRRFAGGARTQFLKFGVVGVIGFVVDTATVYGFRRALGIYGAGMIAYVAAASVTWALNRTWTFRGRGGGIAMHRQWLRFLAVNLIGFTANRGTFVALVASVPLCARVPVIPVAAGAIAGMFLNFALSRALVFPPTQS